MEEKISDLLKLKDILEIVLDDPYQDVYDEVSEELAFKEFNAPDLFCHCVGTCHKIFELSEFRYGKAVKNIPPDFLDEIAMLYWEKFYQCSGDENPEKERYTYPTSCLNFPDNKFSIADLSAMIMGENTKPVDRDSKRIELWKLNRNYLRKFFGIEYEDKSFSESEKYETLRLLKILYDCINECQVDLAYLLRMSALKQNWKIPNSYSKAFEFIKERVIVRNLDSGYRVDFRTIMDLEKYNNSVRSFINFFSEGIINHILEQLDSPCCRVKRFICEKIYQRITANLSEMKSSSHEKLNCSEAIQCYAYEHFLMMDIADENYSEFYSEFFAVEAEEDFYSRAEDFLLSNEIESVPLEKISDLAEKRKQELTKIIHADIGSDKELRKFSVRIGRHKEDYAVIGRVYNLGINRDEFSELSGLETLSIIYLYEYLSDTGKDIPLYSGYNSIYEEDKKQRDLKIKALVKQLRARLDSKKIDSPLSDEEYFLACSYLTEQMYILTNHRTIKIQILREKMKSALLRYWKETIPLLTESGYTVPLEGLIEKIFPLTQRQEIIDKALQI